MRGGRLCCRTISTQAYSENVLYSAEQILLYQAALAKAVSSQDCWG